MKNKFYLQHIIPVSLLIAGVGYLNIGVANFNWTITAPNSMFYSTSVISTTSQSTGSRYLYQAGATNASLPERPKATNGTINYTSSGDDIDATGCVQLKGDKKLSCSFTIKQSYNLFGTYYRLDVSNSSGFCLPKCSMKKAEGSCLNNKLTGDIGDTAIVQMGSHIPSWYQPPKFTSPLSAPVTMTDTPILTENGSTLYRVKIHSGNLAAFDYFSPKQLSPTPIADDPYPGHFHIAFEPYKVQTLNRSSTNYVIPISTVHLDFSDVLISLPISPLYYTPVYLKGDTEFIYQPANCKVKVTGDTISVSQSLDKTLTQDTSAPYTWHTVPFSLNQQPASGQITLKDHEQIISDSNFDLSNYKIFVAYNGQKINDNTIIPVYGNGLHQATLYVKIATNDSQEMDITNAFPQQAWIYQHIFFRYTDASGKENGPILTGEFNKNGYAFVSPTKGPYAHDLSSSAVRHNKKTSDLHNYYLSAWYPKKTSGYIKAVVCIFDQSHGDTPDCTSTGIPIHYQTIINDLTGYATKGEITFSHSLYSPINNPDATITSTANSGPMFVDNSLVSGSPSTLPYPLIYGLPNYGAAEISDLLTVSGNVNKILANTHIKAGATYHLNVVDIYGNGTKVTQ